MKPEKKNDVKTELKDEELNDVSGGVGMRRPSQIEMKRCAKCGKPIPAGSSTSYCDLCLTKLRKTGFHPLI